MSDVSTTSPPHYFTGASGPRITVTRGVFWLSLLTTLATFPLIFMGGLVTSHHAGLSVPDWPNSFGYNMFLYPPSHWVEGIFYEHTHRLMGTVVGFLSLLLAIWAWRAQIHRAIRFIYPEWLADWHPPTERHRYVALAVLAAVIFQGVLGGLRVVLVKLDLAIVHACVAQAFFCLAAYTTLIHSRFWQNLPDLSKSPTGQRLSKLGIVTVVAIYCQLIVGATLRHYDAGLAIPDLPLAYGKVLPPTTPEALHDINTFRASRLHLDPVTLTQIWLHFAHRIGALIVTALALILAHLTFYRRDSRHLALPAAMLALLILAQLTLGVLTVLLRKPADVASLHVATGALVLMTCFILACGLIRVYRPRRTAKVQHYASLAPKKSALLAGA